MEQELTLTLIEPRPVTPQDVIDFNEAVPQRLGYTFVPVAVISEYSINQCHFKEYFVIGKVVAPGTKPELLKILIKNNGAKWEFVKEGKVLNKDIDFDINELANMVQFIKVLGDDEPARFYAKYPPMIGVEKKPLYILVYKNKEYYIVNVTIMNRASTTYLELLPY